MRSCGPVCEISRTTSETSIIESPFSTPSLKSSKNKSFMRPPVRIQSHITITEHGFQGSKKIMPEESKLWSGALASYKPKPGQEVTGETRLPAVLAHRPPIETGKIFLEQHHPHRHRAAHAILPVVRSRVAFEEFLRHAAVPLFILGNSSIRLLDPFRYVRRVETHLNEIICHRLAGERQTGDPLAGFIQTFHGIEHGNLRGQRPIIERLGAEIANAFGQ